MSDYGVNITGPIIDDIQALPKGFEVRAVVDVARDLGARWATVARSVPEIPWFGYIDHTEITYKWHAATFDAAVSIRRRLDALPFVTAATVREL